MSVNKVHEQVNPRYVSVHMLSKLKSDFYLKEAANSCLSSNMYTYYIHTKPVVFLHNTLLMICDHMQCHSLRPTAACSQMFMCVKTLGRADTSHLSDQLDHQVSVCVCCVYAPHKTIVDSAGRTRARGSEQNSNCTAGGDDHSESASSSLARLHTRTHHNIIGRESWRARKAASASCITRCAHTRSGPPMCGELYV